MAARMAMAAPTTNAMILVTAAVISNVVAVLWVDVDGALIARSPRR